MKPFERELFFQLFEGELIFHLAGGTFRVVGGTQRGAEQLRTASLERTPLGPTRGNLIGEN